jgi:hypothetical protein
MNHYEAKQAEKKAFYAKKAEALEKEATQLEAYDKIQMAIYPPGQPILVGHHSEKKHRTALKRSHKRCDKIRALLKRADYYWHKAGIRSHAISSDDPDALLKLETKLLALETWLSEMKRINREYRHQGIACINTLPEKIKRLALNYLDFIPNKPFPNFALQNTQAEIRRIKHRLAKLKQWQNRPAGAPIKEKGYTILENNSDNRLWFVFDEPPNRHVCQILRCYGFRFSYKRNGAWVRQLTPAARQNAQYVRETLKPLDTLTDKGEEEGDVG